GAPARASPDATRCRSRACPPSWPPRRSCSACSGRAGRRQWWCRTRSGRRAPRAARWARARGPPRARWPVPAATASPPRLRAAPAAAWEAGAAPPRCAASALAPDRPPDEVIVVDNPSSEPERARLGAAHYGRPGVRLLLLDENRQFAGGLNAGAEAAIAAGAERLLLLNNDTVLAPDALGRLAAALDARPRAGLAGPRLTARRE